MFFIIFLLQIISFLIFTEFCPLIPFKHNYSQIQLTVLQLSRLHQQDYLLPNLLLFQPQSQLLSPLIIHHLSQAQSQARNRVAVRVIPPVHLRQKHHLHRLLRSLLLNRRPNQVLLQPLQNHPKALLLPKNHPKVLLLPKNLPNRQRIVRNLVKRQQIFQVFQVIHPVNRQKPFCSLLVSSSRIDEDPVSRL